MLIGYVRISTDDQLLDLQRDAMAKAGCERVFEDTASGAKADRIGLAALLANLRRGDTVVWSWLSGIAGLPSGPPLQAGACGVFSGALAYRHGGRRAFLAQAVEQVVAGQGQVVDHPLLLAGPGMLDAAAEQLRLVEQLQVVGHRLAAMTG